MASFQTFDLGQVLSTAENIKSARRQSKLDELREISTRQQIDLQGQQAKQAQAQFSEKQRLDNTQWLADATDRLLTLPEDQQPALAQTLHQEGQRRGLFPQGQMPAFNPEGVRKLNQEAKLALGATKVPQSAQGKIAADLKAGLLTEEQAAAALAGKPNKDGLKAIVGPGGKPVFVPESEAAGKTPYYKPAAGMRIKSDGAGGFELYQGDDAEGINLGKSAETQLQKGAIDAQAGIDRLRNIRSGFDPKWLNYKEQATQFVNSMKAKGQGLPFVSKLTPQETSDLTAFSRFKSDTLDNANRYIQEITGAAMGVEEGKRIISVLPNMDDDPASFEAKMDRVEERLKLVLARSVYTQKKGIKFDALSVDEMRSVMNKRGDELYRQNLATTKDPNAAKAQTVQALQSEFYQ